MQHQHMSGIDCLFVSNNDWANMGYLLAKSLQSVGVNAKAITSHKHPFGYKEEAELCTDSLYAEYVAKAKVVVAMHSEYKPCNYKKLWVFHGGSAYRHNHVKLNELFNPLVTGTILQHWEFLNKGAKNPYWVLPPIDLSIKPDYTHHGKLFAHYPRGSAKGTRDIVYICEELGVRLNCNTKIIPHNENMKRMSDCDIYIEMVSGPEWGMTALEAAALGKIVVTTFNGLDDYKRQYGECELVVANNKEELRERIKEIMNWTEEEILEKKKATRQWAERYHSFQAVGQRLKDILC